jgi:putative FmdB family regulatory protein
MPIFEYQCRGCGHQFEFLIIPSSPTASCPSCKSKKLDQQISLCSVSSESTRAAGLRAAKKRDQVRGKEMAHEEHKAFHKEHGH